MRLCGAQKVRYSATRSNGSTVMRTRIVLPGLDIPGAPLWNRAVSHRVNAQFIDAVVDAASAIPVSLNFN